MGAGAALVIALAAGLIGYGNLSGKVQALQDNETRLERNQEQQQKDSQAVSNAVAEIKAKVDYIYDQTKRQHEGGK